MTTIKKGIEKAKKLLCNIDNPQKEAELILAYFLDTTRIYIHSHQNNELENLDKYLELVKQRSEHKPLEYITNLACFYGYDFYVDENVLIPRSETEILIETIKNKIDKNQKLNIVDIGCGSGIIAIILAKEFPNFQIYAVDISQEAIKIAIQNAKKFNVYDRIKFINSNLLDNLDENIDIIVSNPPYISENEKLEKNVFDYEPHLALFSRGVDVSVGDEILKKIIDLFFENKCKYLFCEMGYNQKESISRYVSAYEYSSLEFYKDLASHDRGFIIRESLKTQNK